MCIFAKRQRYPCFMKKITLYAIEKITAKTVFIMFADRISMNRVNRMLSDARKHFNIKPYGYLSVDKFVEFYNIPRETTYYEII